ncbi:hypothetical protein HYPSUDRAFT_205059 [Hypholoma sublateritium FD-334 SS-4]|uniref:Uncharacterized protein n=1 Tax=Hypholoma sublateritium (strain FD-334 SS-4) TaxID=945553 RepID=A0A0D2NPZ3_HYPSF|nr:hypothetical protein HYPSUDRAFT_205059 [Hypholoma sublateritium FD-334 SS-4]
MGGATAGAGGTKRGGGGHSPRPTSSIVGPNLDFTACTSRSPQTTARIEDLQAVIIPEGAFTTSSAPLRLQAHIPSPGAPKIDPVRVSRDMNFQRSIPQKRGVGRASHALAPAPHGDSSSSPSTPGTTAYRPRCPSTRRPRTLYQI